MTHRQLQETAPGPQSTLFPRKFSLTIEQDHVLGWVITTDVHRGYIHVVLPEQGLADGLREVPMGLRQLLVAQMDADRERLAHDARKESNQEQEEAACHSAAAQSQTSCDGHAERLIAGVVASVCSDSNASADLLARDVLEALKSAGFTLSGKGQKS